MARISHEKLVRAKHPRVRVESHKQNLGKRYYLVRLWDDHAFGADQGGWRSMWTGCGDTKPKAWKDAADRLGLLPTANRVELRTVESNRRVKS